MEDIEPTIEQTLPQEGTGEGSHGTKAVVTDRTSLLYNDTQKIEHQKKLVEEAVKAAEEISSQGREGSIGNDSIEVRP